MPISGKKKFLTTTIPAMTDTLISDLLKPERAEMWRLLKIMRCNYVFGQL
jgi:hypothetical protein